MTATMTRETASAAQATPAKKVKKSPLKNKKVLILVVCVLAVAGAAYKMLMPSPPAGPPKGGDIVAMEPTTLNLADGHYLQIAVAIQLVQGKATPDKFQTSEASELLIDEFSNRSQANLSSNANRKKLLADFEAQLKKAYPGEVFSVFNTQFVMK